MLFGFWLTTVVAKSLSATVAVSVWLDVVGIIEYPISTVSPTLKETSVVSTFNTGFVWT